MNEIYEIKKEFLEALENKTITFDDALNYIDKLIDAHPNVAKQLLIRLGEEINSPSNVFIVYLHGKIKDKKKEKSMTVPQKQEYEQLLEQGRQALRSRQNDLAYNIFSSALTKTKLPIFKYYLGKTCYYSGKYDRASNFFVDYIANNSEKFSKANLYLWVIAAKNKNYKQRVHRMAILYYLPKVFDSERAFDDLVSRLKHAPSAERLFPLTMPLSPRINTLLKPVEQPPKDTAVSNHSERPSTLQTVADSEQYADFYSFGFEDQMDIIHKLYLAGNITAADKLLKMAESTAYGNRKRQQAIKKEKGQRHVYVKIANQK